MHLIMCELEIILKAVNINVTMTLQILNKCMYIPTKANGYVTKNGYSDLIILCISRTWT